MVDPQSLKNLKAVVFDLDDTLFDTYGMLVKTAVNESVTAMIKAGLEMPFEEAVALRDKIFKEKPRTNVYQEMCRDLKVSEEKRNEISQAGFHAFHNRTVETNIKCFDWVFETLKELKKRYKLFLVTVGDPHTQTQKIRILGLQPFFDHIYYSDIRHGHGKSDAFKEILSHFRLRPQDVLSVGNRIDSEISDSKRLGMNTCLVLHGEYLHLTPSNEFEKPDFEVKHVGELIHRWKL